jgi:hypothetical protein
MTEKCMTAIDFTPYGFELVEGVETITSIGYRDGLGDHGLFSCIIVTLRDGKVYYGPLKNGSDALADMHELSREWERLGGGK